MQLDDLAVGKRIFVGDGTPRALGVGEDEIRGSAYIEGPIQAGNSGRYSSVDATLMLAPLNNDDCDTPDNTLFVKGQTTHQGDYQHTGDMTHRGDVEHFGDSYHEGCFTVVTPPDCNSEFGGNINTTGWVHAALEVTSGTSMTAPTFFGNLVGNVTGTASGNKAFDIPHPTKEGWRLRHVCLEGPAADIYVRGRVTNKTKIELPEYWSGLVDSRSITVSLTPIGAHQDIIVKRISDNEVHLQAKGGMPIDCFYHIYGERMDGEKLIVEYEGETPEAYPGNNAQYSIAGYHYDQRG